MQFSFFKNIRAESLEQLFLKSACILDHFKRGLPKHTGLSFIEVIRGFQEESGSVMRKTTAEHPQLEELEHIFVCCAGFRQG